MWIEDLLSMQITSTRLVTASIQVNACKFGALGPIVIFHDPMRSTATSNHGVTSALQVAVTDNSYQEILFFY